MEEEIAWKVASLEEGNYLFWFTETAAERRSLLIQFFNTGIQRKEKLLVLGTQSLLQASLSEDVKSKLDSIPDLPGQLDPFLLSEAGLERREIRSAEDVLEFLRMETARALEGEFSAVRVLVEMDAVFSKIPDSGQCFEAIHRFDAFFPKSRCTGLFLVDPTRIDPGMVSLILASQARVGINDTIYQNPQATPVSGFLQAGDLSRLLLHRFESQLAGRLQQKAPPEETAWFHAVFNNMACLAVVLGVDGTLLQMNQMFLDLSGSEPASVIGRPFWELPGWANDPDARGKVEAAVRRAAMGEYVRLEVDLEGRFVRKLCINLAIQPVTGPPSQPRLLVCTGRNSTVVKDLDRRLYDQEQLLTAVLGGAPLLLFLAGADGKIRYSGAGTGTAVDEFWRSLPGRSVSDSFADVPEIPLHYERAMRGESFSTRFEQSGVTFEIRYSPIADGEGQVRSVAAVAIDVTGQVRAEDTLFKQLSRYQAVVTEAPVGIQFLDEDGRVLDCNPAMLAMLGYSAGEMRGRRSADFLDASEAGKAPSQWEALAKGEIDHYQSERRYLHAEGNQIRVQETVSRLLNPTPDSPFAFALVEDISEALQAEQILRESETRLRTVLASLPVILWTADREGTITLCEGRGLADIGLTPGELVGRAAKEFPGDPEQILACCQKALAGEEAVASETAAGIVFEARYSPLADAQGKVTGLVAVWVEPARLEEGGEGLRREDRLLKQALEKMPIGIWLTDEKGKILSGNPAGQALWGYSELDGPEWFTEYKAWSAKTGKPIHNGEWAVIRAVEKGETTLNEPIEIEAGDGTRRTILNSAIPLRDQAENIVAAVVVNEDITERVHTERELAEVKHRLLVNAETERLRLAQDLHDGPIQDLYGTTFQLNELQDALEHTELMPVISSAHETLRQVISVLRRMCSEMRPPALAPFGLEKAVRSHTENFCKHNPGLAIHLDLVPDGQQLPEQVRMGFFRIYQELLNNVVRHSQATEVNVQFGLDVEYGWLEVADNGRGFEMPQRWVDLVRQGHLGLVGIQERTEALGGSLTIQSSTGEGTRVRVVIPRDGPREGFPAASLKK